MKGWSVFPKIAYLATERGNYRGIAPTDMPDFSRIVLKLPPEDKEDKQEKLLRSPECELKIYDHFIQTLQKKTCVALK
ncbi:MAG TPA: hypothetical protein V6D33_13930 [Cyanophyceae cyanobacterium]